MSRKRSRQLAFRSGNINAAGGKPIDPSHFTHRSVVAAQFHNSAVTAGDHMVFNIANFNTPLKFQSSTSYTVPVGISSDRHPSGHVELIQDGYNTYQVMKSHYRMDVSWRGSTNQTIDFIVGYKFDNDFQTASPVWTASVVTTENWLDLQASPGWVWNRYGCDAQGTRKSWGVINIAIPSVPALVKKFKDMTTTQHTPNDYKGVIADSDAAPVSTCALHIVAFIIQKIGIPAALNAGEIMTSIRCTQSVRVWKNQVGAEFIDEGDDA